jgi:hypothetical protein
MAAIEATLQALVQRLVRDLSEIVTRAPIHDVLSLSGKGGVVPRAPRRKKEETAAPRRAATSKKNSKKAAKPTAGRKKATRQVRRTTSTLESLVEQISSTVRKAGADGATARSIASALDMAPEELTRSMKMALQQGQIRKEGDRRTTRYFSGS